MASLDGSVVVELEGARRKRFGEQVGDSLLCAICLCLFEDPRMLSCNHSYCRRCLEVALVNRVWDPEKPVGKWLGKFASLILGLGSGLRD